jgi:hypothetical protein
MRHFFLPAVSALLVVFVLFAVLLLLFIRASPPFAAVSSPAKAAINSPSPAPS